MVTWCCCQLSEYDWRPEQPRRKSSLWFPFDCRFWTTGGWVPNQIFLFPRLSLCRAEFPYFKFVILGPQGLFTLHTVGFISDLVTTRRQRILGKASHTVWWAIVSWLTSLGDLCSLKDVKLDSSDMFSLLYIQPNTLVIPLSPGLAALHFLGFHLY